MSQRYRVFVYGTLMSGESNDALLEHSEYLGDAETEPEFELVHMGAFPGMIYGGRTAVTGEVYEVDRDALLQLDWLEGHPRFFRREPIRLADGRWVLAYLLAPRYAEARPRIASGSWRHARKEGNE